MKYRIKEKCLCIKFEDTVNAERVYQNVHNGKLYTYCNQCEDGGCLVEAEEIK